ncbi:MAG: hypothetical protein KAV87_38770 [Desulfobacteraceae bacterium]|nr:hypothetical protein [Desulfobacteraceae bacterium]
MAKALKEKEILENLKMLADWIRVKHPGDYFELVVVGGAAMALEGFKNQTMDIDVIRPEVLPEPIVNGVANIGKIRRLGSGWLNSNVANMLLKTKGLAVVPEYFNEISRTIEVGKNLRISIIGRQALISLKLYAATPSYRKHTADINLLVPDTAEITEAVRFVLSFDGTDVRKDDLRVVLKDLGFDFDDIYKNIKA